MLSSVRQKNFATAPMHCCMELNWLGWHRMEQPMWFDANYELRSHTSNKQWYFNGIPNSRAYLLCLLICFFFYYYYILIDTFRVGTQLPLPDWNTEWARIRVTDTWHEVTFTTARMTVPIGFSWPSRCGRLLCSGMGAFVKRRSGWMAKLHS